jgi:hypothetical protein
VAGKGLPRATATIASEVGAGVGVIRGVQRPQGRDVRYVTATGFGAVTRRPPASPGKCSPQDCHAAQAGTRYPDQ